MSVQTFMLTTEYFSLRCIGEGGVRFSGNLVRMHWEKKMRGLLLTLPFLVIISASTLGPSVVSVSKMQGLPDNMYSSP